MDKDNKNMVSYIMNRQQVPKQFLSVKKMLENEGMSDYESVCLERIVNDECFTDEHCSIDWLTLDVYLDEIGILIMQEILIGYVTLDTLNQYRLYLKSENKIIAIQNEQINMLKNATSKTLKEILHIISRGENKNIYEEYSDQVITLIRTEQKARNPFNHIRVMIVRAFDKVGFYARNWRKVMIVHSVLRKFSEEIKA